MLDDTQAIARSLSRPAVFELIFDRHFAGVHRYVSHCLGADAADDVAAETFVRAFAARARYAPLSRDARAWLFAIATNLVRDEVRRRGRDSGLTDRLALQVERQHVAGEDRDPQLHAALLALRAEEREVLVLFAWAELSYDEIAHATGAPIGTVRSRLSRARSQLRDLLIVSSTTTGGSSDG
jgi:RNA polymerase sigma-70 factor (ECF subfamily)